MAILAKECPLCGGKMMPPRCASYLTTVDDPGLPIMERHMKVLIYTCEGVPVCGHVCAAVAAGGI